jgi:hypothetical protein
MKLNKLLLSAVFVSIVLLSSVQVMVNAQQDNFILEAEQRWDTYGVGGTCIPGTHNMAIADVDNDGVNEIITGGFSYMMSNGSRGSLEAPLKIWSYDGQNLTLEKTESWSGAIWAVHSGDADGDGKIEIITSGNIVEDNRSISALRFWNWNGQELVLRGTYSNIAASSIWVGDLNKDCVPEIATVGRPLSPSASVSQLNIWNWNGANLTLKSNNTWSSGDSSQANSVTVADLDNDGAIEIVTVGYTNGLKNSSGQLRVWTWNNGELSLKSNSEWRIIDNTYALDVAGNPMGNTIASNVKTADVDADGTPEILTGGFTYDGSKVNGQLRIWNWNGTALTLEVSQEWTGYDITELKSITINDVDGDNKGDIIGSGVTAGSGGFAQEATIKEYAQLMVWSWDGHTLLLKQNKDWNVDEGVCAWQDGTADLDNDGKIEIVTVGCSYKGTLCDPNLRIWSLPTFQASSSPNYTFAVVIAGAISVAVIIAMLLMVRRKHQ